MRAGLKRLYLRLDAALRLTSSGTFFPVLAASSLIVLLLLARHTSTDPAHFGRWSSRFASLLVFQCLLTVAFGVLCVPSARAFLLRPSPWRGPRRQAWLLLFAGLAALPVLYLTLRKVLFPEQDPVFTLFANLLNVAVVAIVAYVMWRKGTSALTVPLPSTLPLLLLLLFVGQLLLTALFSGQVPSIDLPDESRVVGNALRQFALPDRFVLLHAERNASTWFYFQGFWVLTGAWMEIVGAGIEQARTLNLLVA